MTDIAKELERMIQKAAIDGTFSQDAVAQFHTIVTERDALKDANRTLKDEVDTQRKLITNLQEQVKVLEGENTGWAGREQDLLTRESQQDVLEKSLEYEQLRVKDHQHMVQLIFRNPVTKSQVVTPGHAGHVDQYGNVQNQGWPEKHDVQSEDT